MAEAIRFEAIYAKVPNPDMLFREISAELHRIGQDCNKQYDRFFQTWSERPTAEFKVTLDRAKGYGEVFNYPQADDALLQIVSWVVKGTPPHRIYPVNAPLLRFPGVFTPKTQPGVVDSGAGGKSGPIIETTGVYHPGVEPRNTMEAIQEERRERVLTGLEAATQRGLMKAHQAGRVMK